MNALARKGVLLVFAVILAVGTSIGSLLPTIAYAQEPEYCTIKVTVAPSFTQNAFLFYNIQPVEARCKTAEKHGVPLANLPAA